MALNFHDYSGEFYDGDEGSYFVILRGTADIILIPTLEARDDELRCDFELLDKTLSTDDVKSLVIVVLLGHFLLGYYAKTIKFIQFKNIASEDEFRSVYPG
ncbi:hypothetical protein [Massilia rubra]|uniref:Cyclic nucleotide-binding domain-containing protein n=1 Tax=Massilia rubra TaxID=2607910 RepID=A0ABX0LQ74_9BURK|nr:hypothetical protein [Massilia rubra]NHZ33619.1 hypothetical protein [Massilia rubra]